MLISHMIQGINNASIIGEDKEISSIAFNTSEVKNGSLFFCIIGVTTDGHKFAAKAVEEGAEALVVSKDIEDIKSDKNVTIVKVDDTREAMAIMSANFYGNPSRFMDVVGITGTNGKTTTSFMIKSILDECKTNTGLLGTIYNIYGSVYEEAKRTTPESRDLQKLLADMRKNDINSCIMEVSSHSLALKRVYGVKFRVGIFTNLTQDHLDFHKTMENYFMAKMILFKDCDNSVINIDDEHGKRAVSMINNNVITYGIENSADVMAENITIDGAGTDFTLVNKTDRIDIKLHLPGKFNVYNALSAAAAALALGIPMEKIKLGLESLKSVPGRSEKINSSKGFTIIIDYAHTPDGIVNILDTAREYTKNRLVTVFGCGGDRDRKKRPIMGKAAASRADFCVVTSDNPRSEEPMDIINETLEGVKTTNCPYEVIENRKEAIKYAIDNAQKGDVIVIAGKGHENYQVLKDRTIHFDEREIVAEILGDDMVIQK